MAQIFITPADTASPPPGKDPRETLPGKDHRTKDADEISSDGSASAFEGTESIDSRDQDVNVEDGQKQFNNDPSGRSDY